MSMDHAPGPVCIWQQTISHQTNSTTRAQIATESTLNFEVKLDTHLRFVTFSTVRFSIAIFHLYM